MIVIARALVLAEGDESSADNGVILWENLVTASNIEATSEDSLHPASNLANPATHLFWRGGVNTGDEYLTVTFASPQEIDGIGFARHNLGSANIPFVVEGCADLSESPQVWEELIEERILAHDAPFLGRFELQTLAAIRVRMQEGDEVPEMGVLYVGPMLVLERSIKIDAPHTPFPMGIVSKEVNGKSESGNFLGRIEINRFNESAAGFDWFTPDWYRTNFQPFIVARPPFFYAWNPTEYPNEVGYAWLTTNPMPEVDPVTRRVAIELKMQGIV
jgi:hypothetical protein